MKKIVKILLNFGNAESLTLAASSEADQPEGGQNRSGQAFRAASAAARKTLPLSPFPLNHPNRGSPFMQSIDSSVLEELVATIESRKAADPSSSYVASLLHDQAGNQLLKKIGEEATETVIAGKEALLGGTSAPVVHEVADLWFHTLVLLAKLELSPNDVFAELERRFGRSGHEEKASRKK